MFKLSTSRLLPWIQGLLDQMQRLPRYRLRGLLLFGLFAGTVNALIFYFEPQSHVDRVYNLYVITGFALLLAVALVFKAVTLASHLFVLVCFLFLSLISLLNGGINSPNIGWMPLVPIIALMMFGWRMAVFWLVIISIGHVLQYLAVDGQWVSGEVTPELFSPTQVLVSRVNVLIMLMIAAGLYDWMFSFKRREMAQRNAQLEATQAALLEAQTHKDEFIASVGHELRTPMNAILGLNGVLLSELADHPQHHDIAQHIRDSTEKLLRVVNDILDISQLEAASISFHPVATELEAFVSSCLQRHASKAAEHGLALSHDIDPALPAWVMLDPQRMQQVLFHLLDNAVKFTDSGFVRVHLRPCALGVRFEVEDSGIGIPPERLHNVFNRFEHADIDTHRLYGGTGLGLAICERLVVRQGGQIGLQSQPTLGTLVWFELPLQPAVAPTQPALAASREALDQFSVLVVDDNPVNLLVAELMLKNTWPQVQVHKATSGAQALQMLDLHPDVVFMDMIMPEMDGLDTTRALRRLPGMAQLPVIGLTANSQSQELDKCLQSGMNAVLMKPIDAAQLKPLVEQIVLARSSHA